jgi:hypothetical protein
MEGSLPMMKRPVLMVPALAGAVLILGIGVVAHAQPGALIVK